MALFLIFLIFYKTVITRCVFRVCCVVHQLADGDVELDGSLPDRHVPLSGDQLTYRQTAWNVVQCWNTCQVTDYCIDRPLEMMFEVWCSNTCQATDYCIDRPLEMMFEVWCSNTCQVTDYCMDRLLEMMFHTQTNVGKHVTSNIACGRS